MKVLLKLYSRLNLGDDLFLKIICERYPKTTFYIVAGENYKNLFKWDNLIVIDNKINDNIIAKVRRFIYKKTNPQKYQKELQLIYTKQLEDYLHEFDAFVSLGGSIFMESYTHPYFDPEIAYYLYINQMFKNKPKFFIGCNFGPYNTNEYLSEYQKIFKCADDICFREDYSFNLFKEQLNNIRMAPDVVFGARFTENNKIPLSVGFSIVAAREDVEEELYINKYVELIEYYQTKGYSIYLFSFCQDEGDEVIIERIFSRLNRTVNVEKVFYNGNIDSFLNLFSKMSEMFCGRFHAMILGMLYGQSIYPVIYSKKMTNVLQDISYKGEVVNLNEFHTINIEKVVTNINKNTYNIEQIKNDAVNQFLSLDNILR